MTSLQSTERAPTAPLQISRSTSAVIVVLLGLIAAFTARLWPEWNQNPDLAHGFFAPLIFILLIWESTRSGAQRWLSPSRWSIFAMAVIVSAGFVAFALAGLLAASVAWTHALVLFVLAASLCCFLLGGLLILSDEQVRVVPFNWISLTAIFLWLLVSPLPNGTYMRLTLGLQQGVTSAVFHSLHLFGIPARQHGNVIELATTTVGIEEACSGIRSLLSCVFTGLFLAAWQARRFSSRIILIGVAPLLALTMNFLRSLLLTLLANAGKDITGFWHDATGYAILGVTSIILVWLAIALGRRPEVATPTPVSPASAIKPSHWTLPIFWVVLCASLGLSAFYYSHSRTLESNGKTPPNLAAILPLQAPDWQITSTKDLRQFSDVLQTTHLVERTYLRPTASGQLIRFTVYLAYWPAGTTSVSRVASHTPDACWPGSGWTAKSSDRTAPLLGPSSRKLPPAEHRLFQNEAGISQQVWFWHVYDGRPIAYRDPYSVPALLELSLAYGFRPQGDQCFVRISSNRPWAELAREPLVGEIVSNLTQLGL